MSVLLPGLVGVLLYARDGSPPEVQVGGLVLEIVSGAVAAQQSS